MPCRSLRGRASETGKHVCSLTLTSHAKDLLPASPRNPLRIHGTRPLAHRFTFGSCAYRAEEDSLPIMSRAGQREEYGATSDLSVTSAIA